MTAYANLTSAGSRSTHTQRGVTLIVALIFLGILAILGVTAARNSILEERMAGNTRDRDLAFQSAEAAIKSFETDLFADGVVSAGGAGYYVDDNACAAPGGAGCATPPHPNNLDYWAEPAGEEWSDTIASVGPDIDGVASPPLYVVEKLNNRYRVTARGVGKSSDTVVILQAEYDPVP